MPLALITAGLISIIAAANGNGKEFLALLKGDFTGQNNFFFWLLAIWLVGALGYVDELEPLADGFLVLIVVVILIRHDGFFTQLQTQLKQTEVA